MQSSHTFEGVAVHKLVGLPSGEQRLECYVRSVPVSRPCSGRRRWRGRGIYCSLCVCMCSVRQYQDKPKVSEQKYNVCHVSYSLSFCTGVLIAGTGDRVHYGQDVGLSCLASNPTFFLFEWEVPPNSTILERTSATQNGFLSLLQFTAMEEDNGTFVCTATPLDQEVSFSAAYDLIVGE